MEGRGRCYLLCQDGHKRQRHRETYRQRETQRDRETKICVLRETLSTLWGQRRLDTATGVPSKGLSKETLEPGE